MRKAKYLLAFTIPLAVGLSIHWGGSWSFFAVIYGFVFLPWIEVILPLSAENIDPGLESQYSADSTYDWLLWLMVPVQYALLVQFCLKMSASEAMSVTGKIGIISAFGLACGVIAINVAHELGHRKSKFERWLSRALLATSLNWQFYIEHNRGHHHYVGTPGDSETSRLNENVYAFWMRALRDNLISAIQRDPLEMILGGSIELTLLACIYLYFGSEVLLGFLGSALFGVLLLQSVNYIEHYGLTRKKLASGAWEPILPRHSWNSSHPLSRTFLFELSRHSDHHAHATRKYQILRHLDDSPQMPLGYPAMILLAMIPPLWFKIMNPRININ